MVIDLSMTVREAGRKGGNTVKALYGLEHYKACGRKGGQKVMDTYGKGFYEEIGRKGGLAVCKARS